MLLEEFLLGREGFAPISCWIAWLVKVVWKLMWGNIIGHCHDYCHGNLSISLFLQISFCPIRSLLHYPICSLHLKSYSSTASFIPSASSLPEALLHSPFLCRRKRSPLRQEFKFLKYALLFLITDFLEWDRCRLCMFGLTSMYVWPDGLNTGVPLWICAECVKWMAFIAKKPTASEICCTASHPYLF